MRASIDGLGDAIMSQLEDWSENTVKRAANETFAELAAVATQELKRGGPYTERTGKYTRDWTYDQRNSRASAIAGLDSYSVHNKNHYQLIHLLEKGHQLRRGGRKVGNVKAFEHVAPVNDILGDLAVQKISQKVRG